jgi:hypothetical protein
MSVRLSITSDKALVHQIRVNAMWTSDRIKPELLCPRWLPRHCHLGWLDISFHYIAQVADRTALWETRIAAIGERMAGEWGAHAWKRGAHLGRGGVHAWEGRRARLGEAHT